MKNESRRHRERTLKVALSHVLYAHLRMPRTTEAFYQETGFSAYDENASTFNPKSSKFTN